MKKFVVVCLLLLFFLLGYQQYRVSRSTRPPAGTGQRVVSLSPTLTEIIFELGAGAEVVGVTTYCTYPPEAKSKEKVGDFVNPNFEKMVELRPDAIFAETWSSSKIVSRLRDSGLNVIELKSPRSIQEIYAMILEVGRGLGREARASEVVEGMKRRIEAIQASSAQMRIHPALYIEIDLPSWTVGKASYTSEAIELCGARNIFGEVEKPALQASREAIIQRNPDIILTFDSDSEEFRQRPGWDRIKAVQKGWIISDVGRNMLSHGSHRLVDGMEQLHARLRELLGQTGSIQPGRE